MLRRPSGKATLGYMPLNPWAVRSATGKAGSRNFSRDWSALYKLAQGLSLHHNPCIKSSDEEYIC